MSGTLGRAALAEVARLELARIYGSTCAEFVQPTISVLDQHRYDELAARRSRRTVRERAERQAAQA